MMTVLEFSNTNFDDLRSSWPFVKTIKAYLMRNSDPPYSYQAVWRTRNIVKLSSAGPFLTTRSAMWAAGTSWSSEVFRMTSEDVKTRVWGPKSQSGANMRYAKYELFALGLQLAPRCALRRIQMKKLARFGLNIYTEIGLSRRVFEKGSNSWY